MKFEAFGSSPEFTSNIQKFMIDNCSKLEIAKESGEQSINNYLLFKKYSEMMDKELELFLKKENITSEQFIEACQFAREENLPCSFLDYVLSSIEYEDFYNLLLDYKKMYTKDYSDANMGGSNMIKEMIDNEDKNQKGKQKKK